MFTPQSIMQYSYEITKVNETYLANEIACGQIEHL